MRDELAPEQSAPRAWADVWRERAAKKAASPRMAQAGGATPTWLSGIALDWYLCGGLTLIGAVVRYTLLYTQSLTIDEGSSLLFAYAPAGQLIRNILRYDTHPPLYYLTAHFAYYLLHLSPIDALRIPSFLAGTLVITVMYAIARTLMGRMAAVVAALLTICSPIAIWYSHDGRMYALTWLFTLLSYLLLALVRQRAGWIWVASYSVALALALYADISAWLAIVPQAVVIGGGLVSAYLAERPSGAPWASQRLRAWVRLVAGFLGGLALFLPWLVVFPEQLALIGSVHFGVPSAQVYWQLLLDDLGLTASYAFLNCHSPAGRWLGAIGGVRHRSHCAGVGRGHCALPPLLRGDRSLDGWCGGRLRIGSVVWVARGAHPAGRRHRRVRLHPPGRRGSGCPDGC